MTKSKKIIGCRGTTLKLEAQCGKSCKLIFGGEQCRIIQKGGVSEYIYE